MESTEWERIVSTLFSRRIRQNKANKVGFRMYWDVKYICKINPLIYIYIYIYIYI